MKSAELYAACINKDKSIQEQAYARLWDYLYRIALQIVYDQPDGEALAQDCAQKGLIRIHTRIDECHTPAAFLGWSRTIVKHIALDSLRRRGRLTSLDDDSRHDSGDKLPEGGPSLETQVAEEMASAEIRDLIIHAPLSDRSKRTIVARYFDELPDESLASSESELAGRTVLPSHLQVTRTKNMSKLRNWPLLKRVA